MRIRKLHFLEVPNYKRATEAGHQNKRAAMAGKKNVPGGR